MIIRRSSCCAEGEDRCSTFYVGTVEKQKLCHSVSNYPLLWWLSSATIRKEYPFRYIEDNFPVDHVTYHRFIAKFCGIRESLYQNRKLGTHTMRKIGSMIAIWGSASDVEMMLVSISP